MTKDKLVFYLLCGAMAAGILVCLGWIAWALIRIGAQDARILSNAHLVEGVSMLATA